MTFVALLFTLALAGGQGEGDPCDAPCERRAAEALLTRNDLRPAIERLRTAVDRHPDDPSLPLLLARAYMLDGNLFWAEKTLTQLLLRRPDDVEARSWLAALHLRQGDLDLANDALMNVGDGAFPLAAANRISLLRAYRASLVNEPVEARNAIAALSARTPLFPEDRPVLELLRRRVDPWWTDPITVDLELSAGSSSNALAGAPTDPGAAGGGSELVDGTLRMRVVPRSGSIVQPVLDLELKSHTNTEREYEDLSTLQGSGRAGALITLAGTRVFAGYRAEVLELDQDVSRFSEARRGEIEIESSRGWVVFAGAGHREFRDPRWTRNEWDAGGGGPVGLPGGRSLTLGATVRGTSARSPAWDIRGASVAGATRITLPHHLALRVSGSFSWDDYLHSGGAEGLAAFGTTDRRRDLTGKIAAGVWLPPWRGQRVGIEGQLARRDSTADRQRGFNFDYTERRIVLLVRFGFRFDPAGPGLVHEAGHVPLDWGFEGGGAEAERIIDLLRQDQELRRGSSCGV